MEEPPPPLPPGVGEGPVVISRSDVFSGGNRASVDKGLRAVGNREAISSRSACGGALVADGSEADGGSLVKRRIAAAEGLVQRSNSGLHGRGIHSAVSTSVGLVVGNADVEESFNPPPRPLLTDFVAVVDKQLRSRSGGARDAFISPPTAAGAHHAHEMAAELPQSNPAVVQRPGKEVLMESEAGVLEDLPPPLFSPHSPHSRTPDRFPFRELLDVGCNGTSADGFSTAYQLPERPSEPGPNSSNQGSVGQRTVSWSEVVWPGAMWGSLGTENKAASAKELMLHFVEPTLFGSIRAAVIPRMEEEEAVSKWKNTLIGYFIGPRPYFPHVKEVLLKRWNPGGSIEFHSRRDGSLLFKFEKDEDHLKVLDGGPWFIQGYG